MHDSSDSYMHIKACKGKISTWLNTVKLLLYAQSTIYSLDDHSLFNVARWLEARSHLYPSYNLKTHFILLSKKISGYRDSLRTVEMGICSGCWGIVNYKTGWKDASLKN